MGCETENIFCRQIVETLFPELPDLRETEKPVVCRRAEILPWDEGKRRSSLAGQHADGKR